MPFPLPQGERVHDIVRLPVHAGIAAPLAAPVLTFCLLGPVELSAAGRPVKLTQPVQRILLTTLVLSANRVVSVPSLIDAIWQEEPDDRRIKNLHYHVSRLRALLRNLEFGRDTSRLVTSPPGYRFVINAGERDADAFSQLVGLARDALEADRYSDAAALYRQALSLWRGPALCDVRNASEWIGAEAERLDEMGLSALEERLEADIACQEHRQVVSELTMLVAQHPRRERLRCQLMVALYRCDRQVDALGVYTSYATALRDELGLDPGPAMQQVHKRILTQEL
jgi:DNA-binding SARP family transcriptional activator